MAGMTHAIAVLMLLLGLHPGARAEELIVSAASSLTNAFRDVGLAFERAHPGARPVFNFSASGALLQQIENGAPVDVFASADQETMDRGAARELLLPASRSNFTRNKLVLIQPANGAIPLRKLADLAQPGVKRIAVCNPATVPAGRYARDALAAGKLWERLTPRFILADTVRQALDYVARGEVDAGFVFATDAANARDKVRVVAEVPTAKPAIYPIAVVGASKRQSAAAAFIAYVLSPEGQAILARHGFGKP